MNQLWNRVRSSHEFDNLGLDKIKKDLRLNFDLNTNDSSSDSDLDFMTQKDSRLKVEETENNLYTVGYSKQNDSLNGICLTNYMFNSIGLKLAKFKRSINKPTWSF